VIQETPEQVRTAIENLLRVAKRNGVIIAGFAFGAKDGTRQITNFGNCTDCHKLSLYELLCKECEEKRAKGLVIITMVEEIA
jgi:hypothetical protein